LEIQDEPKMSDTTETREEGGILFRGMPEEEIIHTIQDGLSELSPEGLSRCLNYIQDLRRSKEAELKDDLMRQFREIAERAGMPFERLFPTSRRSSAGQIAPKYCDDRGNSWTGRGQVPRWLAAYEAEGRNREEFRIRDEAAA
jgi:DNA-binding protein H-NS